MPIGARSLAGLAPDGLGWTSAPRPRSRAASRLLVRDVRLVTDVARGEALPPAWRRPRFAARVRAVRRQLDPLRSRRLLAASFAREAFHAHPVADRPTAVRVAYAIRWLELTGGPGPSWPAWLEPGPG